MSDRRRHERTKVCLEVCWEGVLGRHKGTLSDISLGGCFILADSDVPKGVTGDDIEKGRAPGVVVVNESFVATGLSFTGLTVIVAVATELSPAPSN